MSVTSLSTRDESGRQLVRASSVGRALNLVGDRWTLFILYACFLGARRFDDFVALTGMARSLLADRLRRLEAAGILRRELYQSKPDRYAYRLTEMGRDLFGVAMTIIRWEKRWHFDPDCLAHRIVHRGCGKEFTPVMTCGACHGELDARAVLLEVGPGAGMDPMPGPRAQRRSSVQADGLKVPHPMLERSAELLGDRWTAHVIAGAFYGLRKFNEFQDALRIATNILTDRLARLTELRVLRRSLYQTRPERWEYRLTDMGRDLFPIIVELMRWGDRWLAGAAGQPELLRHATCGAPLKPVLVCDQCGEAVDALSVTLPRPAVDRPAPEG